MLQVHPPGAPGAPGASSDRGTSAKEREGAKEYFISISQDVQSFLDDKRPECCDFYYREGGHRCSLTASVTNFKRSTVVKVTLCHLCVIGVVSSCSKDRTVIEMSRGQ